MTENWLFVVLTLKEVTILVYYRCILLVFGFACFDNTQKSRKEKDFGNTFKKKWNAASRIYTLVTWIKNIYKEKEWEGKGNSNKMRVKNEGGKNERKIMRTLLNKIFK